MDNIKIQLNQKAEEPKKITKEITLLRNNLDNQILHIESSSSNMENKINGIAEMLMTLSGITTEFFKTYKNNIETNKSKFKFKQVELSQLEELMKQEQKSKKEWIALEQKSKLEKEEERLRRAREEKERKEQLRKEL